LLRLFWKQGLTDCLPRLVSNPSPPYLSLKSS
jgi:hypothetical protein